MIFQNLFVGYNKEEDFRILICAFCKEEAADVARDYAADSKLSGEFEISAFEEDITDTYFDCDYIVAGGQKNDNTNSITKSV